MQFLFIGRLAAGSASDGIPDFGGLIAQESAKARDYYAAGIFRQVWSTDTGAVVLCEAESRRLLEDHISDLPLRHRGLLDYDVLELRPYNGFATIPDGSG